ncbi:MAG: holo-ACP synthase [Spirochaetaceae bacterium]|nr:MAG: holo-ACP synthase [Spirochaetaceae bacterium]
MILGIGIDVVHVYRLKRWEKIPGLFQRFFHDDELRVALPKGEAGILSLAARFAAKEAFGKALGTGLHGLSLKEIAVMNDELGKPQLHLYGRAQESLERLGGKNVFISLSHERDNALAVVVIERD